MFWIALAAQLSAPTPTNFHWVSYDDVPQYLIEKNNGTWAVGTRLVVAPSGKLERCDIDTSSGVAELDEYTCVLLLKRARFQPARWTDGSPVYGAYRTVITW